MYESSKVQKEEGGAAPAPHTKAKEAQVENELANPGKVHVQRFPRYTDVTVDGQYFVIHPNIK